MTKRGAKMSKRSQNVNKMSSQTAGLGRRFTMKFTYNDVNFNATCQASKLVENIFYEYFENF